MFGNILDYLVQSPNRLTFLSNYPDDATTIDLSFGRTLDNFWNVNWQPIIFVKTCNDFIWPFANGLHWNLCLCKMGYDFVKKQMMGWILVLTRRFIPNHSKKCIMKYQNSSSMNTLKLCFVCELCYVDKHQIAIKITKSGSVFILSRVAGTPL